MALWVARAPKEGQIHKQRNLNYRRSKVRWLGPGASTQWVYDRIWKLAQVANDEMWGFELKGAGENIQLGEYTQDGHYDWHMDCRGGFSVRRKLTVVVQLSDKDDYTGGDLEVMTSRKPRQVPREAGTIILFPSYILHRVTPITGGVRRSMVCWLTGPPLR
jgi:PKHD-type hydroxylase